MLLSTYALNPTRQFFDPSRQTSVAGLAIENKNRRLVAAIQRRFRRACDVAKSAGRNAAVAVEGDVGGSFHDALFNSRLITRVN